MQKVPAKVLRYRLTTREDLTPLCFSPDWCGILETSFLLPVYTSRFLRMIHLWKSSNVFRNAFVLQRVLCGEARAAAPPCPPSAARSGTRSPRPVPSQPCVRSAPRRRPRPPAPAAPPASRRICLLNCARNWSLSIVLGGNIFGR